MDADSGPAGDRRPTAPQRDLALDSEPPVPPVTRPTELGPSLPEAPSLGRISRRWRRRVEIPAWPRPSFAADGGRLGEFELLAASAIGHGHLHDGSQRQDAYHFAAVSEGVLLAVADGVTAMPLAAIGAETAAFSATRGFLERASEPLGVSATDAAVVGLLVAAVERATAAVLETAVELQLEPRQLSTTLLLASVRRGAAGELRIVTAGIGNSSALALRGEAPPVVVAGPDPERPGEYDEFVPTATAPPRVSVMTMHDEAALVLATDGFADDLHQSTAIRAWLWERLCSATGPLEFAHALSYRRQGSTDDLTALAVRVARP